MTSWPIHTVGAMALRSLVGRLRGLPVPRQQMPRSGAVVLPKVGYRNKAGKAARKEMATDPQKAFAEASRILAQGVANSNSRVPERRRSFFWPCMLGAAATYLGFSMYVDLCIFHQRRKLLMEIAAQQTDDEVEEPVESEIDPIFKKLETLLSDADQRAKLKDFFFHEDSSAPSETEEPVA